jgi:DNA-binding NtrC family response regulator
VSAQAQNRTGGEHRPTVLFVDDEQRVLNSMRIMFRRQYDLFLASSGKEALEIVRRHDIDVIVADHRMPQMTGIEVLTTVRTVSPRTIRVLLTGYADLNAVEGSINECEVFRFLTKPCAPDQLRTTVATAADIARAVGIPTAEFAEPQPDTLSAAAVEIILEADTAIEVGSLSAAEPATGGLANQAHERPPSLVAPMQPDVMQTARFRVADTVVLESSVAPQPRLATGLGVLVFSNDEEILAAVQKAVCGRVPVFSATNIVQVVRILDEHRPGVLLTDISEDKSTLQTMTARLKSHLPELVTIVVSEHRDVLDMVWLINHGQIFRFLRKPVSPGRCAVSLQAALQHHHTLLDNPTLVRRHAVEVSTEVGLIEGMLERIKSVKRLWASI